MASRSNGRARAPRGAEYRLRLPATGAAVAALLLLVLTAPPLGAQQTTVTVTITADNAYAFGFGDVNAITSYFPGVDNCVSGDIYNCGPGAETYTITAALSDYLYIVAWSDEATYQGVLAEFTDGSVTVLTGASQPGWEVYAAGMDIDPCCIGSNPCPNPSAPDLAIVNGDIAVANAAAGDSQTTSVTWVDTTGSGGVGVLAFGEANNANPPNPPTEPYPQVCGIDPTAEWMWYNPDPATILYPFVSTNGNGDPQGIPPANSREYLIFRVGPLGDVLGGCLDTSNVEVAWEPNCSGNATVTFDLTNNSGVAADYLLVPANSTVPGFPVTLSPNVIPLVPPLADGDTQTISLTVSNAVPGSQVCFQLSLINQQVGECCGTEMCVDLPPCDCLDLQDVDVVCNSDGTFTYSFTITNISSFVAEHLFLLPQGSVTFTPDYFDLPSIPPNGSITLTTTIAGALPGDTICFDALMHDETLNECCLLNHCLQLPDCGGCLLNVTCELIPGPVGLDLLINWSLPADPSCCSELTITTPDNIVYTVDPLLGTYLIPNVTVAGLYCLQCTDATGIPGDQICCDVTLFSGAAFVRGDTNLDGLFDIADAVATLDYLFASGPAGCLLALDANDDDGVDVADAIYILAALFDDAGAPPPEPFPTCGVDPTPGGLGCDAPDPCL